jgi:hypothetical protein
MDRRIEAFEAAQRIIDECVDYGFDLTDPESILKLGRRGQYPCGLYMNWGATRLVIWDEYEDYVLKIAIQDYYEKYNAHEAEIYWAAEGEGNGVSESFAWCDCYIEPTVDAPGIYVMEYVNCDEDRVIDDSYTYGYKRFCEDNGYDPDDEESADAYSDYYYEDSDEILDYFMSDMSDKERQIFWTFFSEWRIHDVHCQNIGFRGNKPIICDYAGWGW